MKLKQALKGKLTKKELNYLVTSFDIIGNIAIIGIPEELKKKQGIIAKAVMQMNKNTTTVLKKTDIHKGEYRVQKLSFLGGKRTKETVYKENNVQIKLDVEKVYFSQRLSNERKRIFQLVRPNENVLVMFSGVAPFCLTIAKNARPKIVYGIEINPVAHKYAKENVKLNKLFEKIKLYNGDVKTVVPKLGKFDRILMPLPKTGEDFLDIALKAVKKGTTIHFYDFSQIKEFPDISIGKIDGACKKAKKKYKILNSVKCGAYAPYVYRVCIDFQII